MIYGNSHEETVAKTKFAREHWIRVFAFLPVELHDGRTAWLTWVERKVRAYHSRATNRRYYDETIYRLPGSSYDRSFPAPDVGYH